MLLTLFIRAILAFGVLASGYVFAERFVVYAFDPRDVDPASIGLAMQVEKVSTTAGNTTVIWRAPPKPGRPTILYLHGNAGNLAMRHQRFKIILARGYGLIAPGYPGSSGSTGWPTQPLITDVTTQIYQSITSGQITGKPTRPIVYGESLGAAVALQVVTAPKAAPPRAIVLEAPFSTLADVGRNLDGWVRYLTPLLSSEWQSIKVAPKLTAPLLVVHGTKDKLIPIAQGRAVFEAASSPDKEFYKIDGAGHTNLWTIASQRYFFAWIDRRARARAGRIIHPNAVLRPRLPSQRLSR